MTSQAFVTESDGLDVALPAGFMDTGWAGDKLASFIHPDLGLILLIDYPEPDRRQPPGAARFTLYAIDPFSEPAPDEALVESDDYAWVLATIEEWRESA